MRSITDELRTRYISDYLENACLTNYKDVGAEWHYYEDLPSIETEGYPFASDVYHPELGIIKFDQYSDLSPEDQSKCRLRFHYLPPYHEIYLGGTGSGKTTGCIEPQLRAVSYQKNKPNLFISDPKGELFDRNAQHLKDQGYKLFVLNFKDVTRTDKWNPLLDLYDNAIKEKTVGQGITTVEGAPDDTAVLMDEKNNFGDSFYLYKGMAFSTLSAVKTYSSYELDMIHAETESALNQLVNVMIVVQSKKDITWEQGAQNLLKGILLLMLDDALDGRSGFTRDMMNLQNVLIYYNSLRNFVFSGKELEDHPLLRNRKDKRPFDLMSSALRNAGGTMRSYCGVFDTSMKEWFQGHIFAITTGNTVDIEHLDEPFAIFLITRDYEKSDFLIAGIFIDWVYKVMLRESEKGFATRATHFLLDEFGNIPPIKDFENKIATARSRNIWFHLVLQSFTQLDINYGSQVASVIVDNCNSLVFLGSQNMKTKEFFSSQCGKHTVPQFGTSGENPLVEVPLLPISKLDLIKPGQLYVKRIFTPLILSEYVRSYHCAAHGSFAHWIDARGLKDCAPFMLEPFTDKKYIRSFSRL